MATMHEQYPGCWVIRDAALPYDIAIIKYTPLGRVLTGRQAPCYSVEVGSILRFVLKKLPDDPDVLVEKVRELLVLDQLGANWKEDFDG